MAQVPLPVAKGYTDGRLCFSVPAKKKAPDMPKLILHLEGADWELPRDNYVLDNDDGGSGAGSCKSNGTTIGYFQQQNMHIVYDLESNKGRPCEMVFGSLYEKMVSYCTTMQGLGQGGLKSDGSGGTVIDSGTAITSFPQAVFRSLREAFVAQVPLPVAKGYTDGRLCFSVPAKKKAPDMPKLILHLEGADWELPGDH
ncbi:hypothetical protein ZWY2020_047795 [Hordeum vulgare]|nr:hypothetical protein ZWY2020_047795 [Hordeum vulgare]